MDIRSDELYKICVCVPEEFLEKMMDSVNDVIGSVFPGYDRAFSYSRVKGTWRPLKGSKPFKGRIGEIETADEIRLEFVVRGSDLKDVLNIIADVHPYEEPAIDVIPMLNWKDVIRSS